MYYTGLKSHPQYELARKQQKGECGLMSLEIDGDEKATARFVDALNIFERGCSWGGFESLAIAYTYNWTQEQQDFLGVNRSIVRLHCGLEGAQKSDRRLKAGIGKGMMEVDYGRE